MNKRLLVAVITLGLLATGVAPTQAAVKAGAKCTSAKAKIVVQGLTYTCVKSGQKLVWNKGVVSKKLGSSTNVVYAPPSEISDNIELCKINEVNMNGPRNGQAGPGGASIKLPSGFPSVTPSIRHVGTVKWALIPIDFPDLKGESNFRPRVDGQMKLLSEWFETVSEGKFKVEWVVAKKWVTLEEKTTKYSIEKSVNSRDSTVGQALFRDAMNSADPVFDFTGIQTVSFILPKGQKFIKETSQGFPWDKVVLDVVTNEGSIGSYSIPGVFMDQIGREYWSYWAHEFGHAISIPHVGRSRGSLPPFSPFDIMGSQDGSTRELSGWLRFVAGWLTDEKVYCKEIQSIKDMELTLVPMSSTATGLKLAVIPISQTKAILIESRRFTKFSCGISTKNGVLVYTYDANLSHGEDFLLPIYPTGRQKENHNATAKPCASEPFSDPLLYRGNKITIDGIDIEVLLSGNLDRIRVTTAK